MILFRTKEIATISKILLSPNQNIIHITGRHGTGKTHLMKEVYKRVKNRTFSFWFIKNFDPVSFFKLFVVNYPQFSPLFLKTFGQEEIDSLIGYVPELSHILHLERAFRYSINSEFLVFKFLKGLVKIRPVAIFIDDIELNHPVLEELLVRFKNAPVSFVISESGSSLFKIKFSKSFNLKNLSIEETKKFLKFHGVRSGIEEIYEVTRGNPLKLNLFVKSLRTRSGSIKEITCDILEHGFNEFDLLQKRVLSLLLLLEKPLSSGVIEYFLPGHSKAASSLVDLEVLGKDPNGNFVISHNKWKDCIGRSVRIITGKLRRKIVEKVLDRKDLWFLVSEKFLDTISSILSDGYDKDFHEFLNFLYRRFKEEKNFKALAKVLRIISSDPEKDLLLYQYGRLLVDLGKINEAEKIIDRIPNRTLRIRIMGKLAVYFTLNNRIKEAELVVKRMKHWAGERFEKDYCRYIELSCKSLTGSVSGKEILKEYETLIKETPFEELKIMAAEAMLGRKMCLNGWKEVVDGYKNNEFYRNSGNILLCVVNSSAYTGDFETGKEALNRFENDFLHRTSPLEFTNYLGVKTIFSFARGNFEEYRESLNHFSEVAGIYGNKLYEQEIRKAKLDFFRENGDLKSFEEVLKGEWIELGCYPSGWHERFLKVNQAWLLAHRNRISEADSIVKEIWPFANPDGMDVYSIFNLYRLRGLLEYKKGNRGAAEKIWSEGLEKMEKWKLKTFVLLFYRYLANFRRKSLLKRMWRELVLELNVPGWYDDKDERREIFLREKGKIELFTLGGFKVRVPWRSGEIEENGIRYKKALEVLGLLVAKGREGMRREELLVKIWPESHTTNPLDIAISNLKSIVWKNFTITERGNLRLNDEFVKVDAWMFENLARKGIEEPDIDESLHILEEAIGLYKGRFMPHSQILDVEIYRDYLQNLHREAILKLGKIWLIKNEGTKVVLSAYEIIKEDHLDEEANLLLARGYFMMGKRGFALRFLRRFREVYRRELEMDVPAKVLRYMEFLEGQ